MYFLLLAISQLIPALQVGLLVTYFGPIIIVLGLSLMKELWDHINTIIKDNLYNNEEFTRINSQGEEETIKCKDIRAGHFIKLFKDQRIPVFIIRPT